MASSVFESVFLKHLWGTDELYAVFCDENRVQKWFDYEAALAVSQAEFDIIPSEAAEEISKKATVINVDLEEIAKEIRRTKHPLVPAIRALQKKCTGNFGEYIHYGPTTQDVLDTGTILQMKEAHAILLRDLKAVGGELFRLSSAYKSTPMAGRTHGVHALPITFGHKCAIWLAEIGRNYERLTQLETRTFVGSLVGAVGTKVSFGLHAFELDERVMSRLGLEVADVSWHSARDRLVEYVGVLGLIGGSMAKIANEIYNLSHSEVGELEEPFSPGKIGSSTMPHKRNPTISENVVTVGRALRYNVALMQESLVQEYERDGAGWKIEWKALPESCLMAGAMLAQMKFILSNLDVRVERMRRNLDCTGGLIMSERVMFAIGDSVGKQTAHEIVYDASMEAVERGVTFREVLMENDKLDGVFTSEDLEALLDPVTYLGFATSIVERVLAQTRAAGWLELSAPENVDT